MYDPGATDEELAAVGMTRADVEDNTPTEIWPENLQPYEVFSRMRSQWHTGMGGPTGLNYQSLEVIMRRNHIPDEDYDDVFDSVQVMEYAALKKMSDDQKAASKR